MDEEPIDLGTQLVPVHFGLRENGVLSPELPRHGKSDSVASCPKKFVPARWSILGNFGQYQWYDVGTWKTDPVKRPLKAQGSIAFRVWVTFTGTGSRTGEFDFIWFRNDEIIAQVVTNDIRFSEDMPPTLYTITTDLSNQTPFETNDVFSVNIRCRNQFDGAKILYGSREHNTAVVMTCDPLNIVKVCAHDNNIKGVYDDIFQVKPNTMTFIAKVDQIQLNTQPKIKTVKIDNKNYRSANWAKEIKPGTYEIEISISYLGNDNSSLVTVAQIITIKAPPEATLFGLPLWLAYPIILIVVLIVVAVVAVKTHSYYEERKWLEQMK